MDQTQPHAKRLQFEPSLLKTPTAHPLIWENTAVNRRLFPRTLSHKGSVDGRVLRGAVCLIVMLELRTEKGER